MDNYAEPRLVQPNLHVILIHLPIALLGMGLVIEILGFLWRRSTARVAGRWMILLGALAMLPTLTSGIFAYQDVVKYGKDSGSWLSAKESAGLTMEQWNIARTHILCNSIATGLALIAVVGWLGSSDLIRHRVHVPAVLLLIAAMALMVIGAWNGGEMVYRHKMGVEGREDLLAVSQQPDLDRQQKVEKFLAPMQMHVIMAGVVFAVAAAALGLSLRAASQAGSLLVERKTLDEAAADISAPAPVGDPQPVSVSPDPNMPGTATVVSEVMPRIPSSGFWALTALFTLFTILGGLYVGHFLLNGREFFNWHGLQHHLKDISQPGHRRVAMHVVFGSSILILTLILSMIARSSPRNRATLGVFSLLLILVMAAQVCLGILLLYDNDRGPLTRTQNAAEISVQAGE